MAAGDGTEKIVPREEAPVDVNAQDRSARGVSAAESRTAIRRRPRAWLRPRPAPAGAGNGTLPSNEPRKIKTLAVRGDQADAAAVPVNAPPPAQSPLPRRRLQLRRLLRPRRHAQPAIIGQCERQRAAVADTAGRSAGRRAARPGSPPPIRPSSGASRASNGGGYLVQVSSQQNEADAQASYRALQGKYPAVLGSRSPVIKRADLGDKGVYYRAMVGPFGSADEATQFCGSLKTAGGQCVVQRN